MCLHLCLHDPLQLPMIKLTLYALWVTHTLYHALFTSTDAFLNSQIPVASEQGCLSPSFTLPVAALCSSVKKLHPVAIQA